MLCSPMDAARQSIAAPKQRFPGYLCAVHRDCTLSMVVGSMLPRTAKPLISYQSISSTAWFQLRVALRAVRVKTIIGMDLSVWFNYDPSAFTHSFGALPYQYYIIAPPQYYSFLLWCTSFEAAQPCLYCVRC